MTDSEKLDLLLSNMQSMQTDVNKIKHDVNQLNLDVNEMTKDVNGITHDVNEIKRDVNQLNLDVNEMKHEITVVKLTIENEIRVNIQRVAEGHLDLSRNLHEAVKLASDIKSKQEIQDIYLNIHETKLKALS